MKSSNTGQEKIRFISEKNSLILNNESTQFTLKLD
jgi:hypothetical protein